MRESAFAHIDIDAVVTRLRQDGLCLGLRLPSAGLA